jgi:hypothetical protein
MKQSDLFGDGGPRAHARRTDPVTSHEAAASITSERIRQSQAMVLAELQSGGPCHDYELIRRLESQGRVVTRSGIQTRRCELVALGLVEDSGEKVRLETGRRAIVWRAVH